MTDHPLTETHAAELWDEHHTFAHPILRWELAHETERTATLALLRATFDAGREYESESIPLADPRHDPRPWQDCTQKDIRKGDLVEALCEDRTYIGVAHHKDELGDWSTEEGWALTWGDRWPLRRIPAPTAPAEVALPTEFGAVITDVDTRGGGHFTRMARTGPRHFTQGPNPLHMNHISACTLPDGTRARRDGEHEDGAPRFVKEDSK